MKSIFSLIIFLFVAHPNFSQDEFSIRDKKGIQLYKDAEILLNFNKDYARGIFTLRTLLKEHPNFVEAHMLLGKAYGEVGRYKSEKKAYLKIVKIIPSDPRHVTMYYKLGTLYHKEGNYEEAIKFLTKVEQYPLASKTISKKSLDLKRICQYEITRQQKQNDTLSIAQE